MIKEKVESKKKMREMEVEDTLAFPIDVVETVRNNVSLLNTKHYLEGKKWSSETNKEEGTVIVKRVS
ncbi:hypothetical protein [uncultured Bacteroides sp.]|uniref:hypothetical protein n=1 Tax=uncultured Bacteroides sp. TaxID=162156 RepID=UPI0025F784FE|nr:hypothetical protein [uncultured Bacteroides sp.]